MREIKFRGKRIDNGEWVYGNYIKVTPYEDNGGHRICSQDSWDMFEVDPETVGQFTDLKDKNGKEIYEGDILDHLAYADVVVFKKGMFTTDKSGISSGDPQPLYTNRPEEYCLVIGNKEDNELNENNGYAVRGTMRLLQRGDITLEQTIEIVNMWIELTAKKSYAEGELDGRWSDQKSGKEWQTIRDMGI